MSSYFPNFSYLDKNSQKDFGWIVASLDPDNGEMDGGMSQEQIYADSYRGTKRILYGTKYNATPIIKITVVKCDGRDFSVDECRRAYRWLIGNPSANWLNLYSGDELQYSFLITVQDVKPYKLDARTVALVIYCESLSPWAYSQVYKFGCSFDQQLVVDDGVLYDKDSATYIEIDENGVIYNTSNELKIADNGTVYVDNSVVLTINNDTDDLYTYIYLDTVFDNYNSDYVSIKNTTLNEETIISGMSENETITLSNNQFIISSIPGKIFGNSFNFVWPRLAPGANNIVISGSGSGRLIFSYRHPIKVGDCAMNVLDYIDDSDCGCSDSGGATGDGSCYVDRQALYTMLNEVLT